jgi:hypothetical protein
VLDGAQKRFHLLALTMIGVSLIAGAVSFTRSSPVHAQSSSRTNYYNPSIVVRAATRQPTTSSAQASC